MNIKETIRKLLRLAQDGSATVAEAQNALSKAQHLMDKHHIEAPDVDDAEEIIDTQAIGAKHRHVWEGTLAVAIKETLGTIGVYSAKHQQGAAYVFYGPSTDVSVAVEMFQSMRQTIKSNAYPNYGSAYRGDGRAYCMGFANALYTKAKSHRREPEVNAIVLRKNARAELWVRAQGVRISHRKSTANAPSDRGAFHHGQRDGHKATLRTTKKVTNKANLLT